jgi:hypothetical protein
MAVWYCFSKSNLLSIHALVCHQKSYLGISGNRMPSSSTKTPPAAKTWRWWSEYRAKRAVVGVSLSPLWSPFLRGLNSSSRNTSQTTKFLKLSVNYTSVIFWNNTTNMGNLLCELEDVENEFFHFDSVGFVWFANFAGRVDVWNLLFGNVMLQHSFLTTWKDNIIFENNFSKDKLMEKFGNRPDHFAKELRREEMIANISSTECKSSISVSLLGRRQCDFTVLYHLHAER